MAATTAAPAAPAPPPPASASSRNGAVSAPPKPGEAAKLRAFIVERAKLIGRHALDRLVAAAVGTYRQINTWWELARREQIPRLLMAMMLLLLTVAALTYYFETKDYVPQADGDKPLIDSLPTALWWAIVTMTTVGYGDVFPKTPHARLIASGLMVGGTLILSLFTASFASLLVARRLEADRGLTVLKVKNHVIIVGWNRNADQVIQGLLAAAARRPQMVLINQLPDDQLSEIRFRYRNLSLYTVNGDATKESIMARANLAEAAAVIILADTSSGELDKADDRTLFSALAVRDMNTEVKIAAQLMDTEKEAALRHAGVDEIVISGQDTSFFLASGAVAPGLGRAARDLLTYGSGKEMRRIELARELRGLPFRDARAYYRTSGQLLVGIISEGAVVTIGDLLGASTDWVDDFIRSAFQATGQEVVDQDQDRTIAIIPPTDDYIIGNKDSGVVIGR